MFLYPVSTGPGSGTKRKEEPIGAPLSQKKHKQLRGLEGGSGTLEGPGFEGFEWLDGDVTNDDREASCPSEVREALEAMATSRST
eukprot:8727663-Pyramimonas_sp.AAC.1